MRRRARDAGRELAYTKKALCGLTLEVRGRCFTVNGRAEDRRSAPLDRIVRPHELRHHDQTITLRPKRRNNAQRQWPARDGKSPMRLHDANATSRVERRTGAHDAHCATPNRARAATTDHLLDDAQAGQAENEGGQ